MFIAKEEFNNQRLFEVYNAAFMQPEMSEDGEVMLRIEGVRLFARAPQDRPFFILTSGFGVRDGATREQAIQLCNRLNDKMVMIRCCVPERASEPLIWIDHFTVTEGGISAEEIVNATRHFVNVIRGGFAEYDTEHILG